MTSAIHYVQAELSETNSNRLHEVLYGHIDEDEAELSSVKEKLVELNFDDVD